WSKELAAETAPTDSWRRIERLRPRRQQPAEVAEHLPGLEPTAAEMVQQRRPQRQAQAGQVVGAGHGVRGQRQQGAAGGGLAALAGALAEHPPRPLLRIDPVTRGGVDRRAFAVAGEIDAETERFQQVALEPPQ